jgi:hypothetical protein
MIGGGVVNYTCYALMISFVPYVAGRPVIGVAAGSLIGLGVNFLTSKYVLFRHAAS